MRWNWQRPDWPHFQFEKNRLRDAEAQFLKGSGVVVGAMQHLDKDANQQLVVQLMSQEMVESSAIEGEILDRASVQSSIARQLGFAADRRRSTPAEAGASELMADLYRHYAAPLTDQNLFDWHAMLMNGRRDLDVIGRYRTHTEAMQIISGPIHAPHIHFEAPPSQRVPAEMAQFIDWFNRTAPGGAEPLHAVERAAIVHLWFETIHPFEDGNGRIGRAIAEKHWRKVLRPRRSRRWPRLSMHTRKPITSNFTGPVKPIRWMSGWFGSRKWFWKRNPERFRTFGS